MEEEPFTTGSGNVFKDLGFNDQEAEYLSKISRLRCVLEKIKKESFLFVGLDSWNTFVLHSIVGLIDKSLEDTK